MAFRWLRIFRAGREVNVEDAESVACSLVSSQIHFWVNMEQRSEHVNCLKTSKGLECFG